MNSNFEKIIKINKKDIESDDEDFEDEEEVEVEEEEEITSEEAETEEEEELTVLYEEYDIDKIAYLFKNIELFSDKIYNKCKNDEELKKEINKLKNWLEHVIINKGKIKVNYKNDCGRSYGNNSIQTISGYVRNFLLENKGLVDIDIKNAICAILIPVFKKHNIKCETVIYYYENRVKIIDKYYKGNKDLCKNFINSSFFKDAEWIKPLNDFEKKIKKEIKALQDVIHNNDEYEKFKLKSIESCNKKNLKI